MAINQILPFGTVPGANVLDPADYQALAARLGGFSAGTAKSKELNTVWRQASFVAAMIGQYIADKTGQDVLDDGDLAALQARFVAALAASPALTGTPTAPTPAAGDNSARLATTEFVRAALGDLAVPKRVTITSTQDWPIPLEWRGKLVDAFLIGGGGGGGGSAAGYDTWGGGGGGGGAAGEWKWVQVRLPDAISIPVTIGVPGKGGTAGGDVGGNGGAGGVTSLGALASVSGGPGGGAAGGSNHTGRPFPGNGAVGAGTGTGGASTMTFGISGNGGCGASSPLGRGGQGGARSGQAGLPGGIGSASPDGNSGAGGGGGGGGVGTGAGNLGGAGTAGAIIIQRA
ncbi:hypothetical protein [Achromobacter xylosoxidans]|uniref:glycine-rich domain-containing protein n=1 Tax=Alcaligenes xylosoxydans xylosoxydans TaxID=85698 RepID=UPI001F12FE30|nr:hypothetical protein [Achromobacter xylosoxidans]MEC6412202.1 hypothetical protein [Achromobacter xylosoxidans]